MGNVVITALGPLYSLAEVKDALRVESDFDDATIQTYMDAAEVAVLQFCNLSLVPIGKEAVFRTAAIMMVKEVYDNAGAVDALPSAARSLIDPYRLRRV